MFEGFVFELRRRRDSKHEASLLVSSSLLGQKVERLGFVGTSKACHHPSLRPERSREIDNLGRMPKRASRAIKSHLWASRIPPEPGITKEPELSGRCSWLVSERLCVTRPTLDAPALARSGKHTNRDSFDE